LCFHSYGPSMANSIQKAEWYFEQENAFVFAKAEWHFVEDRENVQNLQVSGIPGTWSAAPTFIKETYDYIVCFVCCPNCHGVSILHRHVHRVDRLGKMWPDFQCMYTRCEFHRLSYLDEWAKKPLYAMSIVRNGRHEILYTHATTQAEARYHLGSGDIEIIAIGRAIGFFAEDDHGEKLSTD
jgi:hypothetical protein